MDFFKIFRFFCLMFFIDGAEGGGSIPSTGQQSDPQNPQSQSQQSDPQNPQSQSQQSDPQNPQSQSQQSDPQNKIKQLEDEVKRLRQESEQNKQNQELQALIDQTRVELKAIESTFPEWNENEQKRTVVEMQTRQKALSEQGQSLGDRYKGVSGAFLFWKEHLAGNPIPNGVMSGYTPSESDKNLIQKAKEGTPLTKEERIKILELVKQGV